jgi:hypothetical protein
MDTKKDTADQKKTVAGKGSPNDTVQEIPKPESSSEYEGAPSRKPTGNPPVEIKTETSSSSGE